MSEEIKRCLCGERAFVAHVNCNSQVWCSRDMCWKGPMRETPAEAIAAWNRRAHDGDGWRDIVRSEIINTPETADFMAGVPIEAAHQRERLGSDHDAGKTPFDWFWLVGYLAQKAAASAVAGDTDKALHHTVSTAGALANWHAALSGKTNAMRPGIAPPQSTLEQERQG